MKKHSLVISRVTVYVLSAMALLLAMMTAQAQQTTIEEIVVTAEKREQRLQDVSAAVTALAARDLDTQMVASPEDLNALVPGLTISKSEGFRKIVTIRGLGLEAAQNDVANPSVSYHVDGVYIASDLSLNVDFIDVERVEVLRGPQGTLFGQNSTGGTINVVNRRPNIDKIEGSADLTVGSYDTSKIRGSFNIPLGDTLAARVSVTEHRRTGFAENVAIPEYDLDVADNTGVRAQLLWAPTDTFSALFSAQYFDRDNNGPAQRHIDDPGSDPRKISHDFPDKFSFESKIYSAILEWEFPGFTIKSITSLQDEVESSERDNDRLAATAPRQAHVPVSQREPDAVTQEINIVSNGEDNLVDWVAGVFYLDSESTIHFRQEGGFRTDGTFHERDSFSVYGQGTVNLDDRFRVLGGLRYTDDELKSAVCNFNCATPTRIDSDDNDTTGKIGIEWDVGADSLVYASYSQGFKPGGTNLTFGEVVSPVYESEEIDAFEIGSKNRFFNDRLQLNLSAFFYEYENYQFQTSDPVRFGGGVDNIPESEAMGLEVELSALLGDSFRVGGNFAYLDTEITDDVDVVDAVVANALPPTTEARRAAIQNVKGNPLPKAPEFSMNLLFSHFLNVGNHGTLTSTLQYVYRDELQYRVFANADLDTVEDYDLVNLNFLWRPSDGDWNLEFIVYNLADDDIVNSRFTDNFGVNATSEEFLPPRQFLFRGGLRF